MNIAHVRTFLDLVETRNFGRTAERFDVNQSTISFRIRSLEQALGVRLFVRGRGPAELTPEGARFERYALSLRLAWNLAIEDAGLPTRFAERLRIAMQIQLADRLVDGWGLILKRELPDTAVHIDSDYSKDMTRDLVVGTLDLAVLYDPERRAELVIEHILDESFVMVATRPRSLVEVSADEYIRIRESPQFQQRHAEALPALEHTALSVETASMALTCLQAMDACAYLPRRLADPRIASGSLHAVSDAPLLHQSIHVAYHARNRTRSAVTTAIDYLREIDIDIAT
jgi:DNA-binding transcriptional LysR family regulator